MESPNPGRANPFVNLRGVHDAVPPISLHPVTRDDGRCNVVVCEATDIHMLRVDYGGLSIVVRLCGEHERLLREIT